MKCRNVVDGKVVWFGKTSKDSEIVDNYVSDTDAVASSLTQRLSVLKGELWYQVNYGLPLLEKYKSGSVFDSTIYDIITSHPGVKCILNFESKTEKHTYSFNCKILSIYNEEFNLDNLYNF